MKNILFDVEFRDKRRLLMYPSRASGSDASRVNYPLTGKQPKSTCQSWTRTREIRKSTIGNGRLDAPDYAALENTDLCGTGTEPLTPDYAAHSSSERRTVRTTVTACSQHAAFFLPRTLYTQFKPPRISRPCDWQQKIVTSGNAFIFVSLQIFHPRKILLHEEKSQAGH